MSQQLNPIVFRSPNRGMADRTVLADSLMPPTQMRLVMNMDTDAIGYLTGRKGYTELGTGLDVEGENEKILGLIHHDGTNPQLIAFINGNSYYLNGSTWTAKSLGFTTVTTKIRSVSFLDYVFAVNGTNSPKSWDGSASSGWGATNLTGAPTSGLIATYKQQMFMGNTDTDRVDFSSVPSSGVITWPTDNNFILNPNDGTNLTAINRFGKELLFSKVGKAGSYLYRFNGRSADADPVIYFGAATQETTFVSGSIFWFFDPVKNAVIAYQGGFPQVVSKPIRQFLTAIPTSSRSGLCMRGDHDHVELFIGNVTVDGVAFINVAARYVISTQTWVLRSYANEFGVFSTYDDGTTFYSIGGTNNNKVMKMDTGNTDNGTNINYDLQTAWIVLGGNPAVNQKLAGFSAFMDNARNMMCFYQTDIDKTWRPIGQIVQYVNSWSGINAQFHKIKFRFTGTSSGEPAIFDGFSILLPLIEGIEKSTDK